MQNSWLEDAHELLLRVAMFSHGVQCSRLQFDTAKQKILHKTEVVHAFDANLFGSFSVRTVLTISHRSG